MERKRESQVLNKFKTQSGKHQVLKPRNNLLQITTLPLALEPCLSLESSFFQERLLIFTAERFYQHCSLLSLHTLSFSIQASSILVGMAFPRGLQVSNICHGTYSPLHQKLLHRSFLEKSHFCSWLLLRWLRGFTSHMLSLQRYLSVTEYFDSSQTLPKSCPTTPLSFSLEHNSLTMNLLNSVFFAIQIDCV